MGNKESTAIYSNVKNLGRNKRNLVSWEKHTRRVIYEGILENLGGLSIVNRNYRKEEILLAIWVLGKKQ